MKMRRLTSVVVAAIVVILLVAGCGVEQSPTSSVAASSVTTAGVAVSDSTVPSDAAVPQSITSMRFGERAYSYIERLAVETRLAGTEAETVAAAKVVGWFEDLGYAPVLESFSYTEEDGDTRTSQNVVVPRPGTQTPEEEALPLVIVGAHYDSNGDGLGADDNASGISVVLELAERLKGRDLPYDLVFIAFGAEELGGKGSEYHVSQMSPEDISRTAVMINFDALIFGDKMYVHSGANGKAAPRERMLELSEELGLPIEPGGWPPTGVIPEGYSDHHFFNEAGMPVVFCLSTNWEIGDHDGRTQTAEYGTIWADEEDDLAIIEQRFPGRPLVHLEAYTTLVFEYLVGFGSE